MGALEQAPGDSSGRVRVSGPRQMAGVSAPVRYKYIAI